MNVRLPETIASSQDLSSLILEIRGYSKWLTHESVKNKVTKGAIAPAPQMSEAAIMMLRSVSADKRLSSSGVDELLTTLEAYKQKAPSITLTLAGFPPQVLKNELVAWCRKNIDASVMVNFQVNSTLLGGMVVRYGSRVFDWSFRRALLANAAKFPETLSRV